MYTHKQQLESSSICNTEWPVGKRPCNKFQEASIAAPVQTYTNYIPGKCAQAGWNLEVYA